MQMDNALVIYLESILGTRLYVVSASCIPEDASRLYIPVTETTPPGKFGAGSSAYRKPRYPSLS